MSKLSSKLIQGITRLQYNRVNSSIKSKPFSIDEPFALFPHPISSSSFSLNGISQFYSKLHFQSVSSKPTSSNVGLFQILSYQKHISQCTNPCSKGLPLGKPQVFSSLGLRFFSLKSTSFGKKLDGNFAKKAIDKPITAVTSAFVRYREAIALQADAFCKRNYVILFGAGAVTLCALLWKVMFGIASTVVGLSEGMAEYGFLALSSAIVAFAGLYLRSRFTINPDRVYRMAMRKLNSAAGILEVMGAPLAGTDLRAYVMSGGGMTLKNFKPKFRSKRCFLIFPVRGSERKGLVTVEVRNKKGQYDMKLLAVDIPLSSGPDQRLFLIGDEEEYQVGGGLVSELRDPVIKAMAATKEFDDLDRIEEEEDAERDLLEAERKHLEEIEKLEEGGRR